MFFNSRKRAAALASVVAAATMGAGLIVPVASAADATAKTTSDATLSWSLSKIASGGAWAGGCNFISAGEAGDTGKAMTAWTADNPKPGFRATDGNVSITYPDAKGDLTVTPTWDTKCLTASGAAAQPYMGGSGTSTGATVNFSKGTGTIDASSNTADITWKGSFTVAFYGGMTYWFAADPELKVNADGTATLTADLSGYGTDRSGGTWSKLPVAENQTIAELKNVKVTDTGFTVTPEYDSIKTTEAPDGGSWPQDFVTFQDKTGQASYWYNSGSSDANAKAKAPTPITVAYTTKTAEDPSKVGNVGTLSADPTVIDPTKDQQITVTGKGYTGSGAAYGTYVVIADKSVWEPGKVPTDQSAFAIQKWVRPANDPKDGYANLDKNGNWTQTLDIPANTLDPNKEYVVGTFAAHMLSVTNRNLDHAVALTLKAAEPEATAPAAPAKPTATVAGTMADPYQVKVEWKAPSDGGSAITGYTVTLTPSTGDQITQDVAADATSATFGKLTAPAVSYTASVVAKNEVGTSAASPSSDAVTPNADPTSTPAITVTPTTNIDPSKETTFTVKGTGFTGGAAFYGAYVVVADTDVWNAGQNPSSAKDFVKAAWIKAADIKNGEFTTTVTIPADTFQYGKNYVVGTTAAHGLSLTDRRLDTAKPIALKAQAQVPDAPAKPTASVPAAGSVKVEWKVPSDGGSAITGYTVTLTPSTGAPITRDVAADATSATFDGLTAKGVSYTATVVAKNEAGTSAPSVASAAVTPTEATKPSAPQNVTVKQGAVHELLVSWEKPEDNGGSAITGYTVTLTPKDASAAKVKASALTADVDANTFQHAFSKLDPATEYTASVTAKNAKGTSAAGQSDAAVAPAPIAPKLTFADADGKAITELKLDVDGKATVNAVIAGENTDDVTVAWESSDAAVAKVTAAKSGDKATVTALKSGAVTVTIKATIDDTAVSASMPVTVAAPNTDGDNDSNGNGSADNGNGSTGTTNGNSGSTGSTSANNGTGSSTSTNTNAANGANTNNTAKKTATLSKTGSAVLGVFGAAVVLVAGAGIALAARRRMSRD
ncbi:fibronectin type III domain-containing protein [Bifidobacterium vansinderenii]|uniref:Fibronectin type III domain-containing protein n=1 Tax=Bifidobacterium vansinderenii TaxID=1984871 RepID=A0A229VZV6_9BIFI|nr:fibronectin type III domain-containing protein [Bifidobacterium vansinderenii]OXN01169.1 Fibronectin type III domain-containing protein [Bifidobacterium vansinderenii]